MSSLGTTNLSAQKLGLIGSVALVATILIFADPVGPNNGHYGVLSVIPPLVAILAAFFMRQVILALFLGILLGAIAMQGFSLSGIWAGLLDVGQVYPVAAMADSDHVAVILFTLFIGGMTGIIAKNGGMAGIVAAVRARINTARQGQMGTALMGLAIFFDDYTNTLVVGNAMRPITDKLRVSREKLSYLVDSTAAPVASIALISLWVGYEVGLIDSAIEGLAGTSQAYLIFLNAIPYNFYPILALAFVFMVAHTGRDFGPMLRAERDALEHGSEVGHPQAVAIDDGIEGKDPAHAKSRNAIIPIVVLILVVMGGLYVTGEGETLRDRIGSADSFAALLWASTVAMVVAYLLTVGQRLLTMHETIEAWLGGVRSMVEALVILVMSWTLAEVTGALGTAEYLVGLLAGSLPVELIPTLSFVIAGLTALGTGTSWGTMAILMPIVVPLIWTMLGGSVGITPDMMPIFYASIASVLAGAVWGDHCSPISDTTILSSLATSCDHMAHVRTQMPYALVVGGVSIVFGLLPNAYGLPWWLCLVLGVVVLWVILRRFGQRASLS